MDVLRSQSPASRRTSSGKMSTAKRSSKGAQDRFTNVQLFRRRRRGETGNQIARSLQRGYLSLEDLQENADDGTAAVLRDISEVLKDTECVVVTKNLESHFTAISTEIADAAAKVRKHARGMRLSVRKGRAKDLGSDALMAFNQLLRLARNAVFSPSFRRFVTQAILLLRDTFMPRLALGPPSAKEPPIGGRVSGAAEKGKAREAGLADTKKTTAIETNGEMELQRDIAKRWMELLRELNADVGLRRAVQDTGAIMGMLSEKYSPGVKLGGTEYVSSKVFNEVQGNMDTVLLEFRRMLEALSHKEMEPVLQASRNLLDAIQNDAKLREWVTDVQMLVHDAGQAEAFDEESLARRLREVIDKGRSLWKGRHRELASRALTAYYEFGLGISEDKSLRSLRESVTFVIQDLFLDRENRIVAKPDLYYSLFQQLRPALQAALSGFRIERVEHQDDNIYFVVEDIAFHGLNAVPSELRVTNFTDVAIGGTPAESDIHSELRLSGKGYNVDIRNLMFQYELRQFPRLRDRGLMDIALPGDGLSFDIDLVLTTNLARILRSLTEERCSTCHRPLDDEQLLKAQNLGDGAEKRMSAMSIGSLKRRSQKMRRTSLSSTAGGLGDIGSDANLMSERMFHVKKVAVKLHGLQLRFRHANHSLLYKLLHPFLKSRIEKEIERTMEAKLYNFYDQAGAILLLLQQYAFQGTSILSQNRILRGTDVNVGHVDYVFEKGLSDVPSTKKGHLCKAARCIECGATMATSFDYGSIA